MSSIRMKALLFVFTVVLMMSLYEKVAVHTWARAQNNYFETRFDQAIPFVPKTIVFYMSLYALYWLPPILARAISYLEFTRIIEATIIIFTVSATVYLIVPSIYPCRPQGLALAGNDIFTIIVRDHLYANDLPNNTLPSTHVALVTMLLLATARKFSFTFYIPYLLWGLAIIASTLLVKQHHVSDVVAGAIVGAGAWYWATRAHLFTLRPRHIY